MFAMPFIKAIASHLHHARLNDSSVGFGGWIFRRNV